MVLDRRERFADEEEALRIAMQGMRASLWTCLPGIIQSYDSAAGTVVVQPALKGVVQQQDGTYDAVDLPLLPDVPVVFPAGGACTLTFPLAQGDECLVVFSARCIDGWWQSGGVQLPMEPRLHDLSDGFCIPGPRSKPNVPADVSADSVQLRSDDGEAYVELNPTTHDINIQTSGNVEATGQSFTLTAPTITLNGAVTINGAVDVTETIEAGGDITTSADISGSTVTGTTDLKFGSRSVSTHRHTGVKAGFEVSGGPL